MYIATNPYEWVHVWIRVSLSLILIALL